jgi:hypothetical protein
MIRLMAGYAQQQQWWHSDRGLREDTNRSLSLSGRQDLLRLSQSAARKIQLALAQSAALDFEILPTTANS